MTAEPTRKVDQDAKQHERRHLEDALDEALKDTFPASDPPSILQPVGPPAIAAR